MMKRAVKDERALPHQQDQISHSGIHAYVRPQQCSVCNSSSVIDADVQVETMPKKWEGSTCESTTTATHCARIEREEIENESGYGVIEATRLQVG